MNKNIGKLFVFIVLVSIIIPAFVSAAWWNPTTWNIWKDLFGNSSKTYSTNNNWGTYTSPLGFTMKFPTDMGIAVNRDFGPKESLMIRTKEKSNIPEAPTYCTSHPGEDRCESVKIDGNVNAMIDWNPGQKGTATINIYQKDYIIFINIRRIVDQNKPVVKQILSSIKFNNQSATEKNWKNYTEKQLIELVKNEKWYSEATYFKAVVGNYLVLDQGTAPPPRSLVVYDLSNKKAVLQVQYADLVIKNQLLTYWEPTTQKITTINCPQASGWQKSGLGAQIQKSVSFDLSNLTKKDLGKTRCSATQ